VAIVVFMLIAPLAALSGSADYIQQGAVNGSEGGIIPTIFIGPDRVPVAVYYDRESQMRLSQLSLTGQVKSGVVLSNIPFTDPVRDGWLVDVVAMDGNGLLHVVWTQDGAVWHKVYDIDGNVRLNNHRISAVEATAHSPAIASTGASDGTVAWVTWTETRENIGTHVRIASLDPTGMVIGSQWVDDWTQQLGPTVSDVSSDLEGNAYVTFVADDGAYWAVPDTEGGYDLRLVHGPNEGSLPSTVFHPDGTPYAIWEEYPWDWEYMRNFYMMTSLIDGAPSEPEILVGMAGFGLKTFRPSSILTVANGGPSATISTDDGFILMIPDPSGGFDLSSQTLYDDGETREVNLVSVTTDDRGQTYLGWYLYQNKQSNSYFRVIERASDFELSSFHSSQTILIRSGTDLDLKVNVDNVVGYTSRAQLSVASSSTPPFIAEIVGDELIELGGGEGTSFTVRVTASMTAAPSAVGTITVSASPEGWEAVTTDLEFTVEIPAYQPFIVRGPEEVVSALPGEPVTVSFTIESWSDNDEMVTLEPTVPKGWAVGSEETRSVPAGGSVQVDLEVTAPEGAPEGTLAEVGLGGHTADGTSGAPGHASAVVTAHTGVIMDVGTSALTVTEGSAGDAKYMATREVWVRNTGNQEVDVTFLAHPNRDGWTASTTPASMTLTPGSEATLVVAVGAPDGALWGSSAQVMVVAAMADGPTLDVRYIPCTVERTTAYTVEFLPVSTPLMDGRAEVDVRLSNPGNGFEDLTLELLGVPVGWETQLSGYTEPVRLAPGGTRMLSLNLIAPMGTPPGEVNIVARAWGSDKLATSMLRVVVPERFSVDMSVETEVREMTPPATVVFPLDLVSSGNAAGEARLSLEGLPFGWDYSFHTPEGVAVVSFPMAVGDTRAAQLSLRVPSDADGDHAIDLVVRDRFGGSLDRITLYVRLRLPDLSITDMLVLPADPREGTPMTVRARVLNLGMADAEDVSVVLKEGSTVIDRDTLSVVPRMGELEVVLYMVPQQGKITLVLEVDPANLIRERSESNNVVKRHLEVAGPENEPLVTPAVAQASVAIIVTASILGLLGGTETGKYAFLTLIFIPLYTKIKKNRVLDHYLRGKIHGYIIANPGEHYNAIKDQLEVTNGALSYHLRVLEREGYIRSRMDGIFKRFYPADMKLPTTQRNISSFQEVILTIVKNNQGLSQKDIAKRIGASSQVINYHVKILEDSGLIRVDRSRRRSKVYATDAPTARVAVE